MHLSKPDNPRKRRVGILTAAGILESEGWDVYLGIDVQQGCDIVAVGDGTVRLIRVRVGRKNPSTGNLTGDYARCKGATEIALYDPATGQVLFLPKIIIEERRKNHKGSEGDTYADPEEENFF